MEQIIGRELRRDEHVHHKNGNKADNRPENLELMSASEHLHLHNAPKWDVQKAIEMRRAGRAYKDIAEMAGVTIQSVRDVLMRRGIPAVMAPRATDTEKATIKKMHAAGMKQADIARTIGRSTCLVCRVVNSA